MLVGLPCITKKKQRQTKINFVFQIHLFCFQIYSFALCDTVYVNGQTLFNNARFQWFQESRLQEIEPRRSSEQDHIHQKLNQSDKESKLFCERLIIRVYDALMYIVISLRVYFLLLSNAHSYCHSHVGLTLFDHVRSLIFMI